MQPMRAPSMLPAVGVVLSLSLAAACGSSSSSGGGAPPTQPANGAPIALQVVKFKAGAERDGTVDVKGYNFADRTFAGYTVSVRYFDKAGAPIKVGVGTPFEADAAWTSMSGRDYACKPKSWCTFEIEMIEVPAATAKAEAAITTARALKADGMNFEEQPFWESPKRMSDWPL